jgi:four helix bundle protein
MCKYDLEERLLDYSAGIVVLSDWLPNTRAGSHIGGQVLRSGTSAPAAESRDDFIHKMKLCLKELREIHLWLRLIERTSLLENKAGLKQLLRETDELIGIFVASVATVRRRDQDDRP